MKRCVGLGQLVGEGRELLRIDALQKEPRGVLIVVASRQARRRKPKRSRTATLGTRRVTDTWAYKSECHCG